MHVGAIVNVLAYDNATARLVAVSSLDHASASATSACLIIPTAEPVAIAVALLTAIRMGRKISGGNFNPAVTEAMRSNITPTFFLLYIAAQLIGAALAVVWCNPTADAICELATDGQYG